MNHSFDVDMAVKHGVHAAILHETIRFWVIKNKANGKHLHDGRHWTYNSAKAFCELFPYLSSDQIQRTLKKLEDAGEIVVGCFNASPYDRTRWYSCADGLPKSAADDSAKARNVFPQECATYTSSYQVQTNTPPAPKGEGGRFEEFWGAWPQSVRKVGKKACADKWKRKGFDGIADDILAHLKTIKTSDQWTRGFEPAPLTYLNQERWRDGAPGEGEDADVAALREMFGRAA